MVEFQCSFLSASQRRSSLLLVAILLQVVDIQTCQRTDIRADGDWPTCTVQTNTQTNRQTDSETDTNSSVTLLSTRFEIFGDCQVEFRALFMVFAQSPILFCHFANTRCRQFDSLSCCLGGSDGAQFTTVAVARGVADVERNRWRACSD